MTLSGKCSNLQPNLTSLQLSCLCISELTFKGLNVGHCRSRLKIDGQSPMGCGRFGILLFKLLKGCAMQNLGRLLVLLGFLLLSMARTALIICR